MKCTVCGTGNPDNARFCGICGRPFAEQASSVPESNSSISAAPESYTNAGAFPTSPVSPSSNLGAIAYPAAEYSSSAAAEQASDLLPESASQFDSEAVSESAPEADSRLGGKSDLESAGSPDPKPPIYERSPMQPAPIPIPSAPKQPTFSGSGLERSFTSPEKPEAPKKGGGKHEKEKEKKVVSLSVAIICIIAVFILAVFCGILAQICMRKSVSTDRTDTVNSSYSASEGKSERYECILSSDSQAPAHCKGE